MCLTIWRDELPRNIFQKVFGIRPKIKQSIAKRDIVCYKIYKETDIPGVVEAPYQHTKHIIGLPQQQVEIIFNTGWHTDNDTQRNIYEGYHSFINKETDLYFVGKKGYIIKKCIIPKGAIYYIGNTLGVRDSYVSNQLTIL